MRANKKRRTPEEKRPGERQRVPRLVDLASILAILALAAYGVFRLPYAFRATTPALSESYAVGFNNRVGVLAALVAIGLFCLRNLFWRPLRPEPVESLLSSGPSEGLRPFPGMPKSVLWLFVVIHAAAIYFLYWCLPHLDEYGDSMYILGVLEPGLRYHLRPYIETEFCYGPAFYYLPQAFMAAAKWLGATWDFGYTTFLVCLSAVSLWVSFFLVDNLRVKTAYRVLIFSIVAICGFNIGMAPTCALGRYLAPYAVLLVVHRAATRVKSLERAKTVVRLCILCLLGGLATLAISCDMGIVCIVAICAYCGHRAWFGGGWWLCPPLAAATSLPIVMLAFPSCLDTVFGVSAGGAIIAIYPCPHVALYLLTLFWLLPILLRPSATGQADPAASLLLGWAAIAVCASAAALGRCDALHVLRNGMGAFILAMAVMAKFRQRLFPLYAILFFVWFGIVVPFTGAAFYANLGFLKPIEAAFAGQHVRSETPPSQLAEALGLKDFRSIITPLEVDRATREFLMDSGIYVPQRFPKSECVFSSREVALKLADLSKAEAVLVPEWVPTFKSASDEDIRRFREKNITQDDNFRNMVLGLVCAWPVNFHTKYLQLSPELETARYVALNYRVVRHAAGWVVMVRETAPPTRGLSTSEYKSTL